jgi:hypothetical protein
MNRSIMRCAALAAVAWCGASAQAQGIRWLTNYKQAIEEAKRTQKPIFLEYRCEP